MSARVLVTGAVPAAGLDELDGFEVEWYQGESRMTPGELLHRARGKQGILCLLTDTIDRAVLGLPGLRAVATMSVGYDNVDVKSATELGVMVANTPGILTETTADFTWALLMAVTRRVVEGDLLVRSGRFRGWEPMLLLGTDVYGKCLGVVGMGRIGQAVARRAQGFGMTVIYTSRRDTPAPSGCARVTLDELLTRADFVTLHVPLDDSTHHLIGPAQFERMKPGVYLINTSRGAVIDERALVKALRAGKLAGAALDVYEHEPKLQDGLAELPNVVLAPHIASASRETREAMAVAAARNLRAALEGQRPPNLVNPTVLGEGR